MDAGLPVDSDPLLQAGGPEQTAATLLPARRRCQLPVTGIGTTVKEVEWLLQREKGLPRKRRVLVLGRRRTLK
jgi:hypothetical protein